MSMKFEFTSDGGFQLNGEEQFLVSGEFQYFRVPMEDWRRRMLLLKEAGGNCLATYVPWLIHEPVEGTILFDDVSYRSLTSFLELAREMGLAVILRPGPYVCSELICGGYPLWLIENKKLLLIDDSIVRGTQLRETTEFLYQSGAKEVHVRPACPPLVYGCKFLNFSRSKSDLDLIARRVILEREGKNAEDPGILKEYADPESGRYEAMLEEIRRQQNFTTLRYHRLDDLVESIGLPKCRLCTYCFDGCTGCGGGSEQKKTV